MLASSQTPSQQEIALFISDRTLRTAMIRLNYYPDRYIDASWLADTEHGAAILSLRVSDHLNPHLSRYVLALLQPEQAFDFDFSSQASRLLLLDTAAVQQLLRVTGIVLNASRLHVIIQGKVIRVIKQALGDELYHFARSKARLLLAKPWPYTLAEEAVGVAPWQDKTQNLTVSAFELYFDRCGLRVFGAALGQLSTALQKRLLWKLPRSYQAFIEPAFALAQEPQQQAAATRLLLKVVREIGSPLLLDHAKT